MIQSLSKDNEKVITQGEILICIKIVNSVGLTLSFILSQQPGHVHYALQTGSVLVSGEIGTPNTDVGFTCLGRVNRISKLSILQGRPSMRKEKRSQTSGAFRFRKL